MRTKDDILSSAARDIRDEHHKPEAPLWVEALKIEVWIDIRDILRDHLLRIGDLYSAFKEKD